MFVISAACKCTSVTVVHSKQKSQLVTCIAKLSLTFLLNRASFTRQEVPGLYSVDCGLISATIKSLNSKPSVFEVFCSNPESLYRPIRLNSLRPTYLLSRNVIDHLHDGRKTVQ